MNLFFLKPFFLIGLIGLSLPIIAHLISRKSGIKKSFSAISFLLSSQLETVKRSRIKDLILLIIRSLIIVSLALVFSKPSILSFSYVNADDVKTTAIVIDNSFSMGYRDNFEKAKKEAKSLIESLSDGSFGVVVALIPIEGTKPVITNDKKQMLENLKNLKLSFTFTTNERRLEDIFSLIQKAPNDKKEVFLFSDFQRNGWNNEEFKREWLIPIDVTSGAKLENRAISDVNFKDRGDTAKISVKVSNYSIRLVNDLLATISMDNKYIKGFFNINPSGEQVKDFIVPEGAIHLDESAGKVEISNDNLSIDDVRYFVHSQRKEPRILLVDGDPRENARHSETYYLAQAIETISETSPLKLSLIDNDTFLTDGEVMLKDYNLIFLANVGDITTTKANEIKEFASNGGIAVIFLGDRVRRDLYNIMLGKVLPAEIGTISEGEYFLNAYEFNKFTDGMNEKFKQVKVKKSFDLHPLKNADIILSTSYGTPYLTQGSVDKGNVFLFASTSDTAWNNFPITPVFLPTIKRLLDFSLYKEPSVRNLLVGDSFKIDFPDNLDGVQVITPSGKEIKLYIGNPNFSYTLVPGIYTVKKGEQVLYKFSVNIDPRESNLEKIPSEFISHRSIAKTELVKVLKEIWIYFLWGSIVLFISESTIRFLYSK